MATGGNNRINFQVGFNVDQSSLNQVSAAFEKIRNFKPADFKGSATQLMDIKNKAILVERALNEAFNPKLNSINFSTFTKELNKSSLSIKDIHASFSQLGAVGQNAFNDMSTAVLTSNLNLKQTSSFIQNIGTTLMNTVKWTVASSAIKAFTSSISQAFTYVKSLDSSLNDIRIVTKDSADLMANFAAQANRAASELGRSTLDYTKAALTFYQQGLDDLAVQARTLAVLKAQNITGAGSEMADYLTAVWNGYKVVNEEAELYVDKLAAVADTSASNMSLIAIAMSKVSSAANSLGVDVDSLTAQIATIVATTRLAPESVGNALKTIYARINDISVGADDAEVTLGNYSTQMRSVGINVLDANGRLRDTGDVLDEVGEKWSTLSREQQIFLARTMAGQRQYNKLISLFDNWSKYTDLVTVSMLAQGATELKNAIYMESLAAHTEQLGAAQLRLKSSMVDSDSYKNMIDVATSGITLFANFILSIGGGGNALLMLGSIFTQVFSGTIAKEINGVITNMNNMRHNALIVQARIDALNAYTGQSGQDSTAARVLNDVKSIYADISTLQKIQLDTLIKQQAELLKKVNSLQEQKTKIESIRNIISQTKNYKSLGSIDGVLASGIEKVKLLAPLIKNAKQEWNNFKPKTDIFNDTLKGLKDLQASIGQGVNPLLDKLIASLEKADQKGNFQGQSKAAIFGLLSRILKVVKTDLENVDTTHLEGVNAELSLALKKAKAAETATKEFTDALHSLVNIQNITKGVAGIGQLASGITSLVNLTKIWGNESLSTGEKILQTFTGLSMSIGMITSSFSNMRKGIEGISAIVLAYGKKVIVTQALQASGDISEATTSKLAKEANIKQAAAQSKVSETAFAAMVAENMKSGMDKEQAIAAAKAALANESLATGIKKVLITIAPYVAAIAAIGAAIYIAIKAENLHADAMKLAALAAKEASDHYNELKQAAKSFEDSVSKYNLLSNSLNELTKGTDEWNQKLQLSNDLVLDLINKFPELINYVTNVNGKLTVSEAGFKQMQQAMNMQITNAAISNANMQTNSRLAAINYQASNLAKSIYQPAGSASSNSIEASIEDVKAVAEIFNDALINNNGQINEKLIQEISAQTKVSTEVVSSLVQNSEGLKELANSMEENTKITDLAYQSQAANILQTNLIYKNTSDLIDKAIMEKIAGADLQDAIDIAEKKWYDKLTGSGISKASGNLNLIYQETLKALNAAGYNFKQATDGNGVLGIDSNRRLVFNNGEEDKLYRAEEIASMIAASEALKDLGNSASETQKALQNLQGLDDTTVKGIKQMMLGEDFSNMTREELTNIANPSLLKKYYDANKEVLQSLGYEKAKDFVNAYASNVELGIEQFNSLLQGKSNPVKAVFDHLNLDNISLNLSKQIVNVLQTAFNKGGKEGLEGVKDFYASITNFDGLEAVLKDIDFNTIPIEGFRKILIEAGVATDISTLALEAYINAQKDNSTTTLDELRTTYGTIHGIIDKLKDNGSLSAEDASKLQAAGINLEEYFQHNLDGTWKLKTSAELFYNYANNQSLEGFRAKLEELKNLVVLGLRWNANKYSVLRNNNFEDFSSSAGNATYDNLGQILGASVDQQKVDAQIQFLKYLGDESQIRAEIEAQGYATYLQAQKLALEVSKHKIEWLQSADKVKENEVEVRNLTALIDEASKKTLEFKLDADVNKEKWENLTEYLRDYANLIELVADSVQDNQLVAQLLAELLLRFDAALESVSKNYLTWKKELTSGAILDQVKATNELQNVYSDLLDLPFENLSPDFLKDTSNLELLKQVLDGDADAAEDAYNKLMDLAQADIEVQVGINLNDEDFNNVATEIQSALDQIHFDDLEIGANLDDANLIAQLLRMVNLAGMTAEQATDYLASMGIDAKIKTVDAPLKSYEEYAGDAGHWEDNWLLVTFFDEGDAGGGQARTVSINRPTWVPAPYSEYELYKANFQGFALEVEGAHKKSGGGFKYSNSTHGGGSGKSGGGKKGGSKKSPKKKSKKKGSKKKKKEEKTVDKDLGLENKLLTYDPYEKVTKLLERQSDLLEKLQKQEDKLTGKDRLANLQKQNKTLQKQNQLLRQRQAISDDANKKNTTSWFKKQLKTTTSFKNIIKFDPDGQISDIAALLRKAEQTYNNTVKNADKNYEAVEKKYNNYIKKYNKMSAKKQESSKVQKELLKWKEALKQAEETAKNAQKAAEDKYKLDTELIKSYTEALEKDNEARQNWLDNLDKITEIKFAKVKIGVDLSLEMGLLERDWLDFEDKFIKRLGKDDFLGQAQSSSKKLFSFFDTNLLEDQVKMVKDLKSDITILNKGLKTTESSNKIKDLLGISAADWAKMTAELKLAARQAALAMKKEDLLNYLKTLQNSLTTMQEQADAIRDSVLSGLDKAKSDMDDQISQFERVNSLIEHGAKLSEMLFGEKAYDNAVKFYSMQKENNIKLMQRIALDRAYWENIYQQQRLADDDKRDELLMQKALSNLQAFDDQLRSTLEETIDILHNEWESKVQGTLQKMNNTLTSGYGLDFANEEWDYVTKFDDYFLDNVESKMGIEEIERLFDNASKAAAGDANAQARLSKIYQEQMKTLRNKEKLTQYDIDRAKKMLEIEQARLAIEKTREQKTTMRLRRDSQGNYTYRYVADEDEVADLADKLANLEYNLYEDDKNQYKKNLNQMLSFYEDYQKKMMELEWELQQAKNKGDEELILRMNKRIAALKEYGLAMGDNLALNQDWITSTYWTQSTADSLGIENYTRLLMLETMTDNIPIVGVALQLLDKNIRSAGGFLEALAPFEKEITTASQEYAAALTSAMDAAQTSTAAMTADIDKAVNQTTKIVDNYDTIINKTKEEVDEVGRMLQNVNEAMEKLRSGTELMKELYNSYYSIQNLNLLNAADDKNGTDLVSRVGLTSTTLNEKMENLWAEWKEFYKTLLGADEMATGGYTGAWGDDGRVAVLHEKELVLNAEDTSNLLAAVGAVRDITSRMSIAGALDSLAASQAGLLSTLYSQHSQLDQNVHIEANFPNVTQHTEIEQAFENLVNIASMHASKRMD